MGSGRWDNDEYSKAASTRRASGISDFHYSDTARRTGNYSINADLDPKKVAGASSPLAGQNVRECRDTTEHPLALPIAVLFDVTGSMATYPRELQSRLPDLLAHLEDRVPDPQILFGAVGDAFSDRVPLQVGQFESDNAMDEQLRNVILEGGGGGGNHESYELAFYFLARHTETDANVVRNRKGYAFLIGDEKAYESVTAGQVTNVIGSGLQGDLSTPDIVAEVQAKYNLYFVSVNNSYRDTNEQYWKGLVGHDHYLTLDDTADIVSIIGDTVVAGEVANVTNATPASSTP